MSNGRPGRPHKSDEDKKRDGTFRYSRSDATKANTENAGARRADMTLRNGFAPALRLVPDKLPRWGKKSLQKVIRELPGYDPYKDSEGYYFDDKAAKNAVDWIHGELSHVKGELARQPFFLERWEVAIVANLFGWKSEDDHTRRYRQAFIFVPRKNGKTPLAAVIINYLLFEDGEPAAEIYGAAADHSQACLVFAHARGMILQNSSLTERCKIFNGQGKSIERPDDFSIYRVISSEKGTSHGFNLSGAVVDELHAWRDGELLENLETGTGARRQPLLIIITTSDYERPGSACNEKHEYASKVRDGVVSDATFLPVIYEASIEDDWTDPKVWARANPNLGVSLKREYIEQACKKAKAVPSFENTFKRLHLNIRTEQDVRWIPLELWDSCCKPFDIEDLYGRPCYGGLDLASTSDLTAFVLLFPDDDRLVLVPYFWLPTFTKGDRNQQPFYDDWLRQGLIRQTRFNTTDYATVRKDIREIASDFSIQAVAVDRLFQGAQLCGELMDDGLEVVSFGQGFFSMAAPTLSFETHLKAGRIQHDGNPVLRWMASNVSVETDPAGNMKPTKAKSSGKIDGIVSAIMALGMYEEKGTDVSSYETEGIMYA